MIWSGLHGDMQSAAEMIAPSPVGERNNANGPKVSETLAHAASNGGACIRLYAGNSENPTVLRR